MPTELEAVVFGPAEPWLAARTLRSLARRGVRAAVADGEVLVDRLASASRPVWLVRAGAWSLDAPSPVLLGGAGRPVVALGATASSARWREMLAHTGGDLARLRGGPWPRIDSAVALDPASFAALVAREGSIEHAAAAAVGAARARVVRVPSLDVDFQRSLRLVLAVTTLHRGGAERIVLDLERALRADGHDVLVAVLDRASRATFDEPPGTIHVHARARDRAGRIAVLAASAADRGADVVHVHLLDGDEIALLCECESDVPVAVTVHNSRPGWPAKLSAALARVRRPALVVGCSRDVSRELSEAGSASPVRTIWNGVSAASPVGDRVAERRRLGVPEAASLLLVVANHRPQKRLDRLPWILAAVRERGIDARLVLVGEPVRSDAASLAIAEQLRAAAEHAGVADAMVLAGSSPDVGALYRAADLVLSASAFEGLSLVHLEALAAGLPLVTTRVSGSDELAAKHDRVRVVDVDASPAAIADAVVDALSAGRGAGLAPDFSTRAMMRRHVELFTRVAAARTERRAAPDRPGLVLVTNNFAAGGAQASARRLLTTLSAAGFPVSAVVIEEQAKFPTRGRVALEAAGVPVVVAPRAGLVDPLVTAREVALHVDEAQPQAVLFWNVIPEHKVLIADLLLGVPIWDVSPGEMYFASLERYFRRPRVGSPYLGPRDYGRLLAGAVVKYGAERERAESVLGVRVEIVPNGVVVPAEAPVRSWTEGAPLVVGTLARLSPDKKLEELVEAVAHAHRSGIWPRDLSVRVAGAPERGVEAYAEQLREQSSGLPIAWVGERDSADLLAEIDLFAMISEPCGCPNASLEAMAAGLPVIATDAGGASDQVIDGETGRLVPRGDARALGEAIASLALDRAARVRMGEAAHARALARFDVKRMAEDYARLCLGAPR